MPVYEYQCDAHGVFEVTRPMSAYGEPSTCPTCGETAPRVLVTAPSLGAIDRAAVHAHDVNARASDNPKKLSQHGPGCGCCNGKSKKTNSKTLHHPNGAKSFPSKRPWMIAH